MNRNNKKRCIAFMIYQILFVGVLFISLNQSAAKHESGAHPFSPVSQGVDSILSRQPQTCCGIEQKVVQRFHTPQVGGSSPSPATSFPTLLYVGLPRDEVLDKTKDLGNPTVLQLGDLPESFVLPDDKFILMDLVGIASSDQAYADKIITSESDWRWDIWNQQGHKAFGLCQRMITHWPIQPNDEYMNNPQAQLVWCHDYAIKSYGSWQQAWVFWETNQWW